MKNLIKLFIVFALLASGSSIYAQKFGHIDSQKLLTQMPERDSAEAAIQQHAKELEDQLMVMNKELEIKYKEFIENVDKDATVSDIVKQTKQKELQDMQQRIQAFQQNAQESLRKKEADLLKPILAKAEKAIKEVAKEQKFLYIFNISEEAGFQNSVLYHSEQSIDVLSLVKTKLGI